MEARAKKKKPSSYILAKASDIKDICNLRLATVNEFYFENIKKEGVDAFYRLGTDEKKILQSIEKNRVFLMHDPSDGSLQAYFQLKYQEIAGDNGICNLVSFAVSKYAAQSDFFHSGLNSVESKLKEAGCYRVKGIAADSEYQMLKNFGYSINAPKYRHSFNGISLNFIPFAKTLYFPKL